MEILKMSEGESIYLLVGQAGLEPATGGLWVGLSQYT